MWYYMTLMLRISKLTDYAILVMVELTRRGEMLSAQAVAERVGIELPTASKVLKMLASHGLEKPLWLVETNAGYRASRAADDISVAEVIEAIEGPVAMTECSVEEGLCSQEDHCGLRGNWQRISLAVKQALQVVSLAEMSAPVSRSLPPLNITTLNV